MVWRYTSKFTVFLAFLLSHTYLLYLLHEYYNLGGLEKTFEDAVTALVPIFGASLAIISLNFATAPGSPATPNPLVFAFLLTCCALVVVASHYINLSDVNADRLPGEASNLPLMLTRVEAIFAVLFVAPLTRLFPNP